MIRAEAEQGLGNRENQVISYEGLVEKGKRYFRLANEGRAEVNKRWVGWTDEIKTEGKEFTYENMVEKYLDSQYLDNKFDDNKFFRLARRSIEARLRNLYKKEADKVNVNQVKKTIEPSNLSWAYRVATVLAIEAGVLLYTSENSNSTIHADNSIESMAKVSFSPTPNSTSVLETPTVILTTPTVQASITPERKIESITSVPEVEPNLFVIEGIDLSKPISVRYPWNNKPIMSDPVVSRISDSFEVKDTLANWVNRPHVMGIYPTNQKESFVFECHSFLDKSGYPLDCERGRTVDYRGDSIILEQSGVDLKLRIVDSVDIPREKYLESKRKKYDLTNPPYVFLKTLEEYTAGKVRNEDGHVYIVFCQGVKVNGEYSQVRIYDTMIESPGVAEKGLDVADFDRIYKRDSRIANSREMADVFNEYIDSNIAKQGIRLGDYIYNGWYTNNKDKFSSIQRQRIEQVLKFANEKQVPQCIYWQSIMAAVNDSYNPLMLNGVNIGDRLSLLIPRKNNVLLSGQWDIVQNEQGMRVAVGDVPFSEFNPGDVIVTTESHVIRVEAVVRGSDGRYYMMLSDSNSQGDGRVYRFVVKSLIELKEIAKGSIYLIEKN